MLMLLITATAILIVISQSMLKYAMMGFGEYELFKISSILKAFSNPWVIGSLFLCGCTMILWLNVLTKAELSYAYSMGSLTYVLVTISGWLIFKEQITSLRLAGIVLICLGVFLVSKS